jgi:hypothetical protein
MSITVNRQKRGFKTHWLDPISIDNVEKYANILNNFDDAIKLTDKIAEILASRLLP